MRHASLFWLLLLGLGWPAPGVLGADPYYPPLDAHVDTSAFPQDLVTADGDSFWEQVRVKSMGYEEISLPDGTDVGATLALELVVEQGLEFGLPGLDDVFTLELGAGDYEAVVTAREAESAVPEENYPFIATLAATGMTFRLLLDNDFIRPLDPTTLEPLSDPTARAAVELASDAELVVRTDWDGALSIEFEGAAGPPLFHLSHPVMLGASGVVLEVDGLSLDLSELGPAADPDPAWRGVRIDAFTVRFTNGLEVPDAEVASGATTSAAWPGVDFTGFEIGTGGFSGRMCGTGLGLALPDPGLFGLDFEVDELCLEFARNALSASRIVGTATDFPFFESDVQLSLALDLDGSFAVGLADPDPGDGEDRIVWTVTDVLNFYVDAISFEMREEVFLVSVSGDLEPLFLSGADGMQAVEADGSPTSGDGALIPIDGLTITSAGDVAIDGGWIVLPQKRYIDFKSFKITLSQIGFGANQDTTGQSWFGFTGGVELVSGLDAEAELKRLQFLWPATGGGAVDVKLEGIQVAYEQPGVLRFEGAADWFETAGDEGAPGAEGFAGKMDIGLPAINLDVNGRVVVGAGDETPGVAGGDFKFFYIDLETQFPAGVPVFTGISLYGLSGLFAYNMSPQIAAYTSPVDWYNAYRTADNVIAADGSNPATWAVKEGALALGAGVILGTADNGFTVNGKVALTVALPGPTVILSGQANVLKNRSRLADTGDTPDFVALAVFDPASGVFLINIGVFYDLIDVVEVSGEAEAFFDLQDPSNWHLYLGQKDPEDRRITASVLGLVTASGYYMIEPDGLAFGAKMQWGDSWKFGPLEVVLMAWFAYDSSLSWRPIQVWGSIDVGGAVELSAFGIGVGLSASATLELETPEPYRIEGSFNVKLNAPWPLDDPSATVKLKWGPKGPEQEPLDEVLTSITLHGRKDAWVIRPELVVLSDDSSPAAPDSTVGESELCAPGESIPAAGSLDVDVSAGCGIPMVPLDSFVSARFERSVNDPEDLGFGNAYDAIDCRPDCENRHVDVVDQKTFQYDLTGYELLYGAKESGFPVTVATAPAGLYASWTSIPATASEEMHNNLDLLSKNPYRYYENATYLGYPGNEVSWTDWAAGHYGGSYCLEAVQSRDQLWSLWELYLYDEKRGAVLPGFIDDSGKDDITLPCPLELSWMEEEDFILPPYSVFRFVADGEVAEPDDSDSYRKYRDAVYFHTEGPPLELDRYVEHTVPEFPRRPHYRGHDVALRFNENYLRKLYADTEDQFFELQVLDESENPVGAPGGTPATVTTTWSKTEDALLSATEAAWVEVLELLGALSADELPQDDLVTGSLSDAAAVRPGQRHVVRAWLEDERLATDTRLDDSAWLAGQNLRYASPDQRRVVLYEFEFTASRYPSLTALFESYRGAWFGIDVAADRAALGDLAAPLDEDFVGTSSTLGNGDSGPLGVFLRHLLAPSVPADFGRDTFLAYAGRAPGYAGDASTLSESQIAAIEESWTAALEAFAEVDALLDLELGRQPLPEEVEVSVLQDGGVTIGYLVELPEGLDLSRVEVEAEAPGVGGYRPTVVPDADGSRLFVFRRAGGSVATLGDGDHALIFTFHGDLGARNPRVTQGGVAVAETVRLELAVPGGRFEPEADP